MKILLAILLLTTPCLADRFDDHIAQYQARIYELQSKPGHHEGQIQTYQALIHTMQVQQAEYRAKHP